MHSVQTTTNMATDSSRQRAIMAKRKCKSFAKKKKTNKKANNEKANQHIDAANYANNSHKFQHIFCKLAQTETRQAQTTCENNEKQPNYGPNVRARTFLMKTASIFRTCSRMGDKSTAISLLAIFVMARNADNCVIYTTTHTKTC